MALIPSQGNALRSIALGAGGLHRATLP